MREIKTKDEQYLISLGWETRGIGLWEHPNNPVKFICYTKEEALQIAESFSKPDPTVQSLLVKINILEQKCNLLFYLLTKSLNWFDNKRKQRKELVQTCSTEAGALDHDKLIRYQLGQTR